MKFVESARKVLELESQAISNQLGQLDKNFDAVCESIMNCNGRIVVTGMGKSGHIANKIAATMASTGSPAFFVHPAEASHGDLGMITDQDVVIALSNSGETDEITSIVPLIKRKNTTLVSMTGNPQSTLATKSDYHIHVRIDEEACPLNLAPTSSTTAMLAIGDAIAIALLEARGFTREDFAMSHPSGSLGKKLLLLVDDIMHRGDDMPSVVEGTSVKAALLEITSKRLGMTVVVNTAGELLGVFTDGDLRRTLDKSSDLEHTRIETVMTSNCQTIAQGSLAAEALQVMQQHNINGLVVLNDDRQPIGALNMLDLVKAGVL